LNNLAWLLAVHKDAEFHDPEQAVHLAERACQLTKYEDPSLLDTLATAYEAAGNFAQAAKTTEKIKQLTRPSKLKDLKK
jgi:Flp pilus assembly protein TadD